MPRHFEDAPREPPPRRTSSDVLPGRRLWAEQQIANVGCNRFIRQGRPASVASGASQRNLQTVVGMNGKEAATHRRRAVRGREPRSTRRLARPSRGLVADLATVPGDIVVLGVGGKMGPSLARMARGRRRRSASSPSRASPSRACAMRWRPTASRPTRPICSIATRSRALPDADNVVFMAGRKFGSQGAEHLTWAMNALVPALVAERYRNARIVAFSTGCVYPFWPVDSDAADRTNRSRRCRRPATTPGRAWRASAPSSMAARSTARRAA